MLAARHSLLATELTLSSSSQQQHDMSIVGVGAARKGSPTQRHRSRAHGKKHNWTFVAPPRHQRAPGPPKPSTTVPSIQTLSTSAARNLLMKVNLETDFHRARAESLRGHLELVAPSHAKGEEAQRCSPSDTQEQAQRQITREMRVQAGGPRTPPLFDLAETERS